MPLVELDVQVPPLRQAGEQVALLELEATVPANGQVILPRIKDPKSHAFLRVLVLKVDH